MIIADALDGNVYALASNGSIAWRFKEANPELGQTLTSAPFVISERNRVIVVFPAGNSACAAMSPDSTSIPADACGGDIAWARIRHAD